MTRRGAANAAAAKESLVMTSKSKGAAPATASVDGIPQGITHKLPVGSVVKIFTVTSKPNYLLPWQMGGPDACSGSGFLVAGRRIITNAHVVSNYTQVRVRKHGGQFKYLARVLCINHTCDLALLEIDSDEFWEGVEQLQINTDIPDLDERVVVLGYPMGGDTLSLTRGVVSRVTTLNYEEVKFQPRHGPELLAIQIDAAINSGNSGGPVFRENGDIVGVAFSGYAGSADNIGYIIPTPVITSFLTSINTNGTSAGVCDIGIRYELCENPSMQRKLKMEQHSGIHVIKVAQLGPAAGKVKVGDVITKINDYPVANDGTIPFRGEERVSVQHAISSHPLGKTMKMVVLRDSELVNLELEGAVTPPLVECYREVGTMPSYFIFGGCLFSPMTSGLIEPCIDDFDDESWEASRKAKTHEDEQIVVMVSVLSHPINHGYNMSRIRRIHKCNNTVIRNLQHLKQLVDESDKYVHFELSIGKNIILDKAECLEAEREILKTYAVPAPCSRDLLSEKEQEALTPRNGGARSKRAKRAK